MTVTSDKPRRSKTRQRELVLSIATKLLGCTAVIVTIAVVFRVVMLKLWESPKVDPEYVQSVYEDHYTRRWSGDATSGVALLDPSTAPSTYARAASKPKSAKMDFPGEAPKTGEVHPVGMSDVEAKRDRIESAVRGFFEAGTVQEKLAYCRDSQRVAPLMEAYYRKNPLVSDAWRGLGWVMPVSEPGYRFAYAQALFNEATPVQLVVEETGNGEIKVDWESTVRYAEQDWQEFLRTKPERPTLFRVIASKAKADVSPGTRSAVLGNVALELKHPVKDGTVIATFDGSDPKFAPLIEQLKLSEWKDVPLTLRLCYPGPSGADAVVRIAGVEGKGWLILQNTRS